jgi:lipopolysaccharide biosynthesis glycosyltransferase
MSDCAICYVTDRNFLLPSLLSALEVRKYLAVNAAEIFIFTIQTEGDLCYALSKKYRNRNLNVIPLDERELSEINTQRLQESYTPLGTFGRFLIDQFLPDRIKYIVYLDGDAWPANDLRGLIENRVPEGFIAAVDDTIAFRSRLGIGSAAIDAKAYFRSLGLSERDGYFNAGVFAGSRRAIRDINADAFRFFLNNVSKCVNFDQSAMNAASIGRRHRLSIAWNFQARFNVWGLRRRVVPTITHFNGRPKPWSGRLLPWPEMHEVYANRVASVADFGLNFEQLTDIEVRSANQDFEKKYGYLRNPVAGGLIALAVQIDQYESSCLF